MQWAIKIHKGEAFALYHSPRICPLKARILCASAKAISHVAFGGTEGLA